jgi:adenylate cyclase
MWSKNVLSKFVFVVIIWTFSGVLITIHEYLFLSNYEGVLASPAMQSYDFTKNLIAACVAMGFGGLVFSGCEYWYFSKFQKRRRFLEAFLIKVVFYGLGFGLIVAGTSWLFNTILSHRAWNDPEALARSNHFIRSISFWHPLLPFMVMTIVSTFFIQLSERFSIQELARMMSGQYFKPKQEQRIFMFLDLNHSTRIAEKLGNEKFYRFLNDFFYDIAQTIEKSKGEVVEYVGDQIVICWNIPDGVRNTGCIRCFFEFEQEIQKKMNVYEQTYGEVPRFKAALHSGPVIIGEIGKIKKSIKYSGDVLNTTSRVEQLCREIGARLAITGSLLNILGNIPYPLEKVPDTILRGKSENIPIYRLA